MKKVVLPVKYIMGKKYIPNIYVFNSFGHYNAFFDLKKNSQSTIENAGIKKGRASAKMQRPRLFIHRKHDRLVSVINNIL